MTHYAHSLPNEPDRSKWETMGEHEDLVALVRIRGQQ